MKIMAFQSKKTKIKINKKNISELLIILFLAFFTFAFIKNPSKYINSVLNGIIVYGTKVLPSLFPFFFITKLLSEFNLVFVFFNNFKWFSKFFFNTSPISVYIFFMSIISGYPVGAKLVSEFYEKGLITKNEAHKIITFSSTSGPLFIIGSVGIGFFNNFSLAIIVFLSHVIGAFLNGIIYRNCYKTEFIEQNFSKEKSNNILDDCMYNSIRSVLIVGGYIVIFYCLIDILIDFNILYPLILLFKNILGETATGLIAGLIEVTKGCLIISKTQTSFIQTAMLLSFIISFGGFSIHMQALTFLNKANVCKKFYFLQKITHAIISMCVALLICLILNKIY